MSIIEATIRGFHSGVEPVERFLSGDDVFISYSRRDGIRYATSLARELVRRKFSCRIDCWETVPSAEIPTGLRRALNRSRLLVVVASLGACASRQVELEIREFLPTRRNIVIIGSEPSVRNAIWSPLVTGLTIEEEPDPQAFLTGVPTQWIVQRIEDSCDFVRRNQRLRRGFRMTMAGGALVLSGSLILSTWMSFEAREAAKRRDAAEVSRVRAEDRARRAAEGAEAADKRASAADKVADSQGRLASARQEAAENQGRRNALGYTPIPDLPKVLAAARKLLSLDRPVEASALLSHALAQVPRPYSGFSVQGELGPIEMSVTGKWLAVGVSDRTVRVLLIPSLQEAARLKLGATTTVIASDDSGTTLGAAAGRELTLFDTRSMTAVASLRSPQTLSRLNLNSRSGYVLGSGDTGPIYLWHPPQPEPQIIPTEDEIEELAFTADGRQAIASIFPPGGGPNILLMVDLETGKRSQIPEFAGPSDVFVMAKRGGLISASCPVEIQVEECSTRVWALPELREHLRLPTRDMTTGVFSPDGRYIAAGGRIWETRNGLPRGALTRTRAVVFSSDGERFAEDDRTAAFVSTVEGVSTAVLEYPGSDSEPSRRLWRLSGLSSEGRYAILSNSRTGRIEVWVVEDIYGSPGLPHKGDRVDGIVSAGPNLLVVVDDHPDPEGQLVRSTHATVWEANKREQLLSIPGSLMPAVSPDGRLAAAVNRGIEIRSGPGLTESKIVPGKPLWRAALAYVPNLGFAGLISERGRGYNRLVIQDLERGRVLARIERPRARAGFTPDGRFLYLEEKSELRLFEIRRRRWRSFPTRGGNLKAMVCPPGGDCLAAFVRGQSLHVRDLERGEDLLEIAGPIEHTALSRDGTLIAVHTGGGAEVWDIPGRVRLARRSVPAGCEYLTFDAAGRYLIAAIRGRVESWIWRPEDLVEAGCERIRAAAKSALWSGRLSAAEIDGVCPLP